MMWNIFKRNSKTLEIEHLIDLKSTEIKVHEFLFEHGKSMIANCIAKSDILTIENGENVKKSMFYLLNVRPNRNQTATEFWSKVIDKYYSIDGEALIVIVGNYLYVADSYSKSNDIINSQRYTNVQISLDNNSMILRNEFNAENSILIRRTDKKVDRYLTFVNDKISDLLIAVFNGYRMKASKFKMIIPSGFKIMRDDKIVTGNEYTHEISKKLNSSESTVIPISDKASLESIQSSSNVTSQEFKDIYNQAANNVAMALNIPVNAFLGTITEKSDAIDEMITFAVQVVVEQINDALNYGLMKKETYLNGNYVLFDLSRSKHRDIISSSVNIEKLISNGFSFNQIMWLYRLPEIPEDWANEHYITKNYANSVDMKGGGTDE
ncbi:phage portal protein, HK97 family [Candidatus Stoquefichus sp. KLE1796]|nr:phage portal protein, HK97 family [Candidatus Stoquefichus sp. KLE1796]